MTPAPNPMGPPTRLVFWTGPQKTRELERIAWHAATDPTVRGIAARVIARFARDDHRGRLAALHRWVRDAVTYYREPVETIQDPAYTATHGGDCDDLAALLVALAWSVRYPGRIVPIGGEEFPRHYSTILGFPYADDPAGDASTSWVWAEPSAPARFGESPAELERRPW